MSTFDIIALVVTAVGVLSFSIIFTVLYRSYALSTINEFSVGHRDLELIDEAIFENQAYVKTQKKILNAIRQTLFYLFLAITIPALALALISKFNSGIAMVNGKGIIVVASGSMSEKNPANGYLVLESSDLSDPAEKDSDPNYPYESQNHIFKGGLSGKKNVKIELYDGKNNLLDTFKRGEEGAGWNQVEGFVNNKQNTFSRVPDGTGAWAYAAPTKGAANGEKTGDIEQQPKVE